MNADDDRRRSRPAKARAPPPTALDHPHDLGAPPGGPADNARPVRASDRDRRPRRLPAVDHDGTSDGPAATGDRRLHRGRAEPGHHGDERLGRGRASLVAQPRGAARCHGLHTRSDHARVRARVANDEERPRLWSQLDGGPWGDIEGYAARRSRETPIVKPSSGATTCPFEGITYTPAPGRHSSAVEQLFRKQQVLGSNPSVGSTPLVSCFRKNS